MEPLGRGKGRLHNSPTVFLSARVPERKRLRGWRLLERLGANRSVGFGTRELDSHHQDDAVPQIGTSITSENVSTTTKILLRITLYHSLLFF